MTRGKGSRAPAPGTKPEREDEGSQRTCIVTRARLAPDELMRFALAPTGEVTPDIRRKLPGRGVWVQATRDAVAEAVRRKAFARGFKTAVTASAELPDQVDELLQRDALQSLAMANKAGHVFTGAFKVEAEIAQRQPAAIVEALDGSRDGARKIAAALTRRWGDEAAATPRVELFSSGQLDLALGRTNVIHAALRRGAASDAFLARCRRLARYRAGGMAEGPPDDAADGSQEQGEPGTIAGSEHFDERGHGPGKLNE